MSLAKKVALLGFDCAITPLVRKHIEEGICPNFKKVFENGTVAENCLTPFPTITPPNWTCMATGAHPGTNDITDFTRKIPGLTPEGYNTHNCFNWEHVKSESIWEAAEKVGKKSIIFNYPMSYNVHKKLKNAIVLGGAALTPGVFMDAEWVARTKNIARTPDIGNKFTFSEDVLVTTGIYSGNSVKVKFDDANGWSNVDDMGDDPLDVTYQMPFSESIFDTKPATWHVLVRDMKGDGYDTVTLSPTKNFKDAFFTIKTGEWANAFEADGLLADGGVKKIHMKAKLVELDEDCENFRLYLTHALNKDGEYWIYPPEKAALLNKTTNIATNNTGMLHLTLGWFDLETWLEEIGIHYDWLADSAEALLQGGDWDIFYSHAHPTDYIYHVLMTELDEKTCSSKEMHDHAWELHRELYRHADRYLGRLLTLFNENETIITLISDHGATPDGPLLDMPAVLNVGGFTYIKEIQDAEWLNSMPANIRASFARLGQKMDTSRSVALPQRSCYIYINLKGRDPEGIVDPKDYEKLQRQLCDFLLTYIDPRTGTRPFCLALPKEEAKLLGLWGEQCGDVVYAVYPEFAAQHGAILPSTHYGSVGEMRPLCVFYGAGVKKDYSMERVCSLIDLVPTYCHMTGWPVPEQTEGAIIYQILDNHAK